MAPSSSHLRLHIEPQPAPPRDSIAEAFAGIDSLCQAFERATGWEIRVVETSQPEGSELWSAEIPRADGRTSRLVVERPLPVGADGRNSVAEMLAFENVRPLALVIGSLLSELSKTRHALWQREAELAAGVPVTVKPNEEHLAERLENVLKGGVEAIGADAAGLYLLDEATTSLKLRASFNLPPARFLDPPRPLRGSVADLEALVGHAVVLEDTAQLPHWKCPEAFPSAICVPVSSPTVPLGTLWCFSREPRDFSGEQTNLLEIIAGRLAADLEREMLMVAGVDSQTKRRQQEAAVLWRRDRRPQFAPESDLWDIAGWCSDSLRGDEFFDWTVLADGRIAFTLAAVNGDEQIAPLHAAGLQIGWRTQASYHTHPAQLMTRLNESLWSTSAGDFRGTIATGGLDDNGQLELSSAGNISGCLLRKEGRIVLGSGVHTLLPPLGLDGDTRYTSQRWQLDRGDLLLLLSPAAVALCDEAGLRIGEASLFQTLQRQRTKGAEQIARLLQEILQRRIDGEQRAAFVVVKRIG